MTHTKIYVKECPSHRCCWSSSHAKEEYDLRSGAANVGATRCRGAPHDTLCLCVCVCASCRRSSADEGRWYKGAAAFRGHFAGWVGDAFLFCDPARHGVHPRSVFYVLAADVLFWNCGVAALLCSRFYLFFFPRSFHPFFVAYSSTRLLPPRYGTSLCRSPLLLSPFLWLHTTQTHNTYLLPPLFLFLTPTIGGCFVQTQITQHEQVSDLIKKKKKSVSVCAFCGCHPGIARNLSRSPLFFLILLPPIHPARSRSSSTNRTARKKSTQTYTLTLKLTLTESERDR
jgi:hypothetical protein